MRRNDVKVQGSAGRGMARLGRAGHGSRFGQARQVWARLVPARLGMSEARKHKTIF